MKAFGIGLAAVLFVVAVATSAFAAKDDIPPEARKAGMTAAPAWSRPPICPAPLADARLMGPARTDKVKTTYYEIACKDALGYVLVAKDKETPASLRLPDHAHPGPDGKPNTSACKLPANLNPGAGLTARSPRPAAPVRSTRPATSAPAAEANPYEVACHEGSGYILQVGKAPGSASVASMCSIFGSTAQIKCELSTPAQQNAASTNSPPPACSPCRRRRRPRNSRCGRRSSRRSGGP